MKTGRERLQTGAGGSVARSWPEVVLFREFHRLGDGQLGDPGAALQDSPPFRVEYESKQRRARMCVIVRTI